VTLTANYRGEPKTYSCFSALDATVCRVWKPSLVWEEQRGFYSGKHKIHCLKYEAVVELDSGIIVRQAGPIRGAPHDSTLSRQSGVLDVRRLRNEGILADKAYAGIAHWLRAPHKGKWAEFTTAQKEFNRWHSSHRTKVENTFGWMKHFAVLRDTYRGNFALHAAMWRIICALNNISIKLRIL
jgi:hypothetical protein